MVMSVLIYVISIPCGLLRGVCQPLIPVPREDELHQPGTRAGTYSNRNWEHCCTARCCHWPAELCPRLGALQWIRETVTWPGGGLHYCSTVGELFRFRCWNARRGLLLHWAGIQASQRVAMSSAMELPAPATSLD